MLLRFAASSTNSFVNSDPQHLLMNSAASSIILLLSVSFMLFYLLYQSISNSLDDSVLVSEIRNIQVMRQEFP